MRSWTLATPTLSLALTVTVETAVKVAPPAGARMATVGDEASVLKTVTLTTLE
jgi:hypothetical protein